MAASPSLDPDEIPDAGGPLRTAFRHGDGYAVLVLVALTAYAWWAALELPLIGEDYRILTRVNQGDTGYLNTFRPVADLWLGLLNPLADGWSLPYHVASLALHALNTVLLFLLAARLLGSRACALVVGAVFSLGAANTDAVVWLAAVNRPLATAGALISLLALLEVCTRPTRAACLCLLFGFVVQLGSNAEAYGTSALTLPWLAVTGLRSPGPMRRTCWLLVGLLGGVLVIHMAFLLKVPGGTTGDLVGNISSAWRAVGIRLEAVAAGFGLARTMLLTLCAVGVAALLLAGRQRGALFCVLFFVTSFLPFVFAGSPGYRHYPTSAPVALLVGSATCLWAMRPHRWPVAQWSVAVVLAGLTLWSTRAPRDDLLHAWAEAGAELSAAEAAVHALNAAGEPLPDVMLNVHITTSQLLVYHLRRPFTDLLEIVSCLDTPTGTVRPVVAPPGPWIGKRRDGSFGLVDPERDFVETPALPSVTLSRNPKRSDSLDESVRRLRSGEIDVTREVLLERDDSHDWPEALDHMLRHPIVDPLRSSFEILVPSSPPDREQRVEMEVRVESALPVLLCVQDGWMYHASTILAPDAAFVLRAHDPRLVKCRATLVGSGRRLRTFFANTRGTAVLVPAGEHVVNLEWTGDLRRAFQPPDEDQR